MEEAFARKWERQAKDRKAAAKKAERDARTNLFVEARREICDRYTALLARNKGESRLKAPRHSLQKIIDEVTQEMNLPPDIRVKEDSIRSFYKNRDKPPRKLGRPKGIPNKVRKDHTEL
jgi:cell division protein FtsI/penicillin-binding protein 2